MREIISTDKAPAAVGAYSQAVRYNDLVFLSGQLPFDLAKGALCTGSMAEQTRIIMDNLQAVAKAAGSDLSRALKLTIFLTDLNDFDEVNQAYAAYFAKDPPARCCVEVSALPKGVKIEVDAIIAV